MGELAVSEPQRSLIRDPVVRLPRPCVLRGLARPRPQRGVIALQPLRLIEGVGGFSKRTRDAANVVCAAARAPFVRRHELVEVLRSLKCGFGPCNVLHLPQGLLIGAERGQGAAQQELQGGFIPRKTDLDYCPLRTEEPRLKRIDLN